MNDHNLTASPAPFTPAVIAPTYNNDATLLDVLDRVKALRLPLIVVNDGATDRTAPLLAAWLDKHRDGCTHVLTHPANQGKGRALRTGFAMARQLGYTHAATIDTDGQLDPEDILALLEQSQRRPLALVLGYRDEHTPDYPEQRKRGRRFGNLGVRMTCGRHVRDSQCGLRVYPLDLVEQTRCRAARYGFENEIITRATWAGYPIAECPVRCRYLPPEQRVTHYKTRRDTFRLLRLNLALMGRELLPWPHRRIIKVAPPPSRQRFRRSFTDWMSWFSPRELWRQIHHDVEDRMGIAAGVTLGAFIACLPAYGYQTLLAIYMSRRLHLHPVATLLGTYLSTPPINLGIWLVSIWLGHLLTTGQSYHLGDLKPLVQNTFHLSSVELGRVALEWILGSILVGLAVAPPAFFATLWALTFVPVETESTRDHET